VTRVQCPTQHHIGHFGGGHRLPDAHLVGHPYTICFQNGSQLSTLSRKRPPQDRRFLESFANLGKSEEFKYG